MNLEYEGRVQRLAAKLLMTYTAELDDTNDVHQYLAAVLGALVFKNLAMSEFKYGLELDMDETPNDSPEDICKELEDRANKIADQIKAGVMKNTGN